MCLFACRFHIPLKTTIPEYDMSDFNMEVVTLSSGKATMAAKWLELVFWQESQMFRRKKHVELLQMLV